MRLPRHSPVVFVFCYAVAVSFWGIAHESVHPYYAAAARSMSMSWHAFALGALDPTATVTVDKLPGFLWMQALSVRVFGPHGWAVLAPQALAGALATVQLHRLVEGWRGRLAAGVAAAIFVTTPAVVVTERSELPDMLLILLLLLAAGALAKAVRSQSVCAAARCGLWIALAFQVKMAQAWLVLPVFAAVLLCTTELPLHRRVGRVAVLCATAVCVSFGYVVAVELLPVARRPFVDGTADDSLFSLIFGYNGIARFGSGSSAQAALVAAGAPANSLGWRTLIEPVYYAPQFAWLGPMALVALVGGGVAAWRHRLDEQSRAGYLLWGGWLVVHVVAFSAATAFHGYYTVVLAPAVAALAGDALARGPRPIAIAVGAAWAVWLDAHNADFVPWLSAVTICAGVLGIGLAAAVRPSLRAWSITAVCLALGIAPLTWSLAALNPVYAGTAFAPLAGPSGSNYRTVRVLHLPLPTYGLGSADGEETIAAFLTAHPQGSKYLAATVTAVPAEPLLDAGAGPVLVLGGLTGLAPSPDPASLARWVAERAVTYVIVPSGAPVTWLSWVTARCTEISGVDGRDPYGNALTVFDCAGRDRPGPVPGRAPS
jgi:4-amino-4-deoxy-L-arabinose transferase-like glycosyltransferase